MKKTSFLKKLTAMAATLAMTCVMAVGAFAAEPAVDYKLDSASISVGETWTMYTEKHFLKYCLGVT